MNKTIVVTSAVLVGMIGFGAGRWSSQSDSSNTSITSARPAAKNYDYQYEPPVISESEAKNHRDSHYAEMQSIENVLELPSDFAQTEALYTVAGRASQSELEELILQSIDIINRYDRSAALNILFSRYAELDPKAAVDFLVNLKLDIDDQVFATVFQAWAKYDLNGAVAGANQLTNTRQRRRASHALLVTASRYHEGLVEQVAADLDDNHDTGHIRSEAIGIRANIDPQGALLEAMAMDGMQGRWDAIRRVAGVWARNDPAQALQFTNQIPGQNMRQQFVSTVLQRWIEDDPLLAMQYVRAHPSASERNQMLTQGLGVYARVNPQDALTVAMELSGHEKSRALQSVVSQWANDDPTAALEAINALNDVSQRNRLIASVGQSLAQKSAGSAIEWLESLDVKSRSSQMPTILRQVAAQDPRRALEYVIANTTLDERTNTLRTVLQHAMMSDPTVAQDYLSQMPASAETDSMYQQLAGSFVRQGSDAAMQWIDQLSGGARASALKGVVQAVVRTDPALAATLIAQMTDGDASETMRLASSMMSHSDPQSALTWLEQFRGSQGYESALSEVVQSVARQDPQQALSLTSKLTGPSRIRATTVALANWAATNPAAAANWASTAEASVRDAALETVAHQWARSDPIRAERWVLSLPSGDAQDRALVSLAGSTKDPGRAADLVNSMSSDMIRHQSIFQAYQSILQNLGDRRVADKFLDNVDASEELRDQLSQMGRQ